jgi:hypothetical protein
LGETLRIAIRHFNKSDTGFSKVVSSEAAEAAVSINPSLYPSNPQSARRNDYFNIFFGTKNRLTILTKPSSQKHNDDTTEGGI